MTKIRQLQNRMPERALVRARSKPTQGILNDIVETRGAAVYRKDVGFTGQESTRPPGYASRIPAARRRELTARAADLYSQGASLLDVSICLDVSPGTVQRLMRDAGIALRPKSSGGKKPGAPQLGARVDRAFLPVATFLPTEARAA